MNENDASAAVNSNMSIIVYSETMRGFVQAESLQFKLNMSVNSFAGVPFTSCGDQSNWIRMAVHSGSAILLLSYPLWRFLQHLSHDGAYGTEGIGYKVLLIGESPMVIVKKIAIDVEELVGFKWIDDSCFFSNEPQNFSVPYGTRVNVGEYTLTPYKNVADDYGFQSGEIFTKWRRQVSREFFGVHCLEREDTTFAMIPSVVVQMSCPDGATRHLNPYREENEEKWANHLIKRLRALGLHARDVHSEHHGIVILNKTPTEFVQTLLTDAPDIISMFKMEHWITSYQRTFCSSDGEAS